MPTMLDTITSLLPSVRRSKKLADLEQAADAACDHVQSRIDMRRQRNEDTRTSMQHSEVQVHSKIK